MGKCVGKDLRKEKGLNDSCENSGHCVVLYCLETFALKTGASLQLSHC